MPRRATSWMEVEKAILVRIANGLCAPGQRIPTCEEFAAEIGVNKNTVSKAYRSLARRQYLRPVVGRGTFLIRRPSPSEGNGAPTEIASLLALAVQEAKLAGIEREQFRKLVEESVGSYYDRTRPRVGFIECSRRGATTLSRDLQVSLSHPVQPLLLERVIADPKHYVASFDILAVDLLHLVTIEEALGKLRRHEHVEVVGVLVLPDPESLTQVARLRANTRLGIVCDLDSALQALTGIVRGCNANLRVTGCLTGDGPRLRRLLAESDALLVTQSATPRVRACGVPMITASFKVDERSLRQLGRLIVAGIRRKGASQTSVTT